MDRRNFLRLVNLSARTLLGALTPDWLGAAGAPTARSAEPRTPNILVIIVDQLRFPQWFLAQPVLDLALPAQARLRRGAVSFERHYTAANACTPARACLLTGLYTHQTFCLLTILRASTPALNTGFPTWGALLRELGYQTYWYGKWHLAYSCDVAPYGFGGGTCPPAVGLPAGGINRDPGIAQQFVKWFRAKGRTAPWCTTVSFINPHDISWYPR